MTCRILTPKEMEVELTQARAELEDCKALLGLPDHEREHLIGHIKAAKINRARIAELEQELAKSYEANGKLLVAVEDAHDDWIEARKESDALREALVATYQALRFLHDHTKNNYQIAGRNVVAEKALDKARALLEKGGDDEFE